jgi:hypothetical protein
MRKTWQEKMNPGAKPKIVRLDKPYAGVAVGAKLLVATPEIVRDYIAAIPKGETRTVREMREDLARTYKADATCPASSGIFVRITAEAALEEAEKGKAISRITPFWRIVDPASPAAQKISCGPKFIVARRDAESATSRR